MLQFSNNILQAFKLTFREDDTKVFSPFHNANLKWSIFLSSFSKICRVLDWVLTRVMCCRRDKLLCHTPPALLGAVFF